MECVVFTYNRNIIGKDVKTNTYVMNSIVSVMVFACIYVLIRTYLLVVACECSYLLVFAFIWLYLFAFCIDVRTYSLAFCMCLLVLACFLPTYFEITVHRLHGRSAPCFRPVLFVLIPGLHNLQVRESLSRQRQKQRQRQRDRNRDGDRDRDRDRDRDTDHDRDHDRKEKKM